MNGLDGLDGSNGFGIFSGCGKFTGKITTLMLTDTGEEAVPGVSGLTWRECSFARRRTGCSNCRDRIGGSCSPGQEDTGLSIFLQTDRWRGALDGGRVA